VPVTVEVKAMNITKMATDYSRPYIYALQAPAASGQNGQLLFINTATGNLDKTLPIGINPTDLTFITVKAGSTSRAGPKARRMSWISTRRACCRAAYRHGRLQDQRGQPGRIFTEDWISGSTSTSWTRLRERTSQRLGTPSGDGETSPTFNLLSFR